MESLLRDSERVSGECSLMQSSMRSRDFKQDVLPYVYQMIHPQCRTINTQLMSEQERAELHTAIEIMVLFDIKLQNHPDAASGADSKTPPETQQVDQNKANWAPDVTSLVCFGKTALTNASLRMPMRPKTQTIIQQNYEIIK